jgi:dihydrofolate reductase / thymidylate synthase
MKQFNFILACQKNGGIGYENSIPWTIKKDLARFKKITTQITTPEQKNAIIMGRKTWESIKNIDWGNRLPFVITTKQNDSEKFFTSVKECIKYVSNLKDIDKIFIIGGASIFNTILNSKFSVLLNTTYLTIIDSDYKCDAFVNLNKLYIIHNSPELEFSFKEKDISVNFYKLTRRNIEEEQYLNLLGKVLSEGDSKIDRTNVGTVSVFGEKMEFNLKYTLPILTTKKVYWKIVLKELLWFVSGNTNNEVLQAQNVSIWNGNSTREYFDSIGLHDRPANDLGPVYGFQWRHFGAKYIDCHTDYSGQGFDQLEYIINEIKRNPNSRRLILSAWNPTDLTKMALPPCFLPGTLVLTDSGYKRIETVNRNDKLRTHLDRYQNIVKIHKTRYSGNVYCIKSENTCRIIKCTPEHPFYINKQWVLAKNLKVGDKVTVFNGLENCLESFKISLYISDCYAMQQKYGGSIIYDGIYYIWTNDKKTSYTIQDIQLEQYNGYVYDFSIEDDHSYTVENVVVHNCHVLAQWYVRKNKYLDCQLYQRSGDIGLGVPFNIASYALLTCMIAEICNLQRGKLIHILGDAHIYNNHIEQLKKQIAKTPFNFPQLKINRKVSSIDDFKEEDFTIENYTSHEVIKMKMAV